MKYLTSLAACALALLLASSAPAAMAQERQTNPEAGSKMERTADKPAPAAPRKQPPSGGAVDTDSVVVQALALVLEKYLTQENGYPVEVTFGKVSRSNAGLEVKNFQMLHKSAVPRLVKAENLLIYKLEPGLQSKSVIKASVLFKNITGSTTGAKDPGSEKISAASLDLKGLDLDASTGNVRIAEGLLKNLSFSDQDGQMALKSLAVKGLLKEKEDLVAVDWGRLERLKFQERGSTHGLNPVRGTGFSVSSVEVHRAKVREKSEQVSLGELVVDMVRASDGGDRYRLGEIRLQEFSFGPPGGVSLKSLELSDMGALMSDEGGLQGMDLASVSLAGLEMTNPDDPTSLKLRSLRLDQLTAYYEGKEVAMLDGFRFGYQEKGPWVEGGLELRDLMIMGASAPKELKEYLVMVGEDDLVFNLAVKGRGNQSKERLEIQQIRLEGRGLGTFEMGFNVNGVKLDPAKSDETLKSMDETATLESLNMMYRDEEFVTSLFTNMAKQQKTTVDKIQAGAIADIKATMQTAKSPGFRKFLEAAIKFLERPGEIKLAAKPAKPVLFKSLQMMGPDQAFTALGIQTTLKPGKKLLVKPTPPPAKKPAPGAKPGTGAPPADKPTEVPGGGR